MNNKRLKFISITFALTLLWQHVGWVQTDSLRQIAYEERSEDINLAMVLINYMKSSGKTKKKTPVTIEDDIVPFLAQKSSDAELEFFERTHQPPFLNAPGVFISGESEFFELIEKPPECTTKRIFRVARKCFLMVDVIRHPEVILTTINAQTCTVVFVKAKGKNGNYYQGLGHVYVTMEDKDAGITLLSQHIQYIDDALKRRGFRDMEYIVDYNPVVYYPKDLVKKDEFFSIEDVPKPKHYANDRYVRGEFSIRLGEALSDRNDPLLKKEVDTNVIRTIEDATKDNLKNLGLSVKFYARPGAVYWSHSDFVLLKGKIIRLPGEVYYSPLTLELSARQKTSFGILSSI